jgi:hypothetical protein
MYPLSEYPFELVRKKLRSAIEELLRVDFELFHFEVNERTLTQRLSLWLDNQFQKEGLNVDCEYNRRWIGGERQMMTKKLLGLKAKKVDSDDVTGSTVYPDIIVHYRGKEGAPSNLLVIEAKRYADWGGIDRYDEAKLEGFTDTQGGFAYTWGAFVNFAVRGGFPHAKITWYQDAHRTGREDVMVGQKKSPLLWLGASIQIEKSNRETK